jgi:YidC/Oxa1 family membrane protein insertase
VETRALLAFVISVAILIGYQALFAPPPHAPAPSGVEAVGEPSAPLEATGTPASAAKPLTDPIPVPERLVEIDAPLYRAVFTTHGARLKSFELKEHRVTADKQSPPLDMVASDAALPLRVRFPGAGGRIETDDAVSYDLSGEGGPLGAGQTRTLVFTGTTPTGVRLAKTVTLAGDSYVVGLGIRRDGGSPGPLGVSWVRRKPAVEGHASGIEGPVGYVDQALKTESISALEQPVSFQGTTSWAGYADHYFLAAFYPDAPRPLRFEAMATETYGEVVLWDDQATADLAYQLFIGPKKIKLLNSLGHDLDEAVDLGYFAFVARPLLELMIFLHRFTHNYGWTIVLITVGIRLAFYPINKRQIEAMKAMQRIQPELKRIQEKFKDDREKLNKEMIEVYRRHKVNPLSGCLPMLVQLPVFLGLYNALMQSIELRHAPFIGWIHDLSLPDRLGSLQIPFVDPPGLPVLTLLMGVSMFVQQKMTPSTADPVQQRMMMFLPAVFTLMFINFPSGLVLYWLANNVLSIAQQHVMTRGAA